jgi:hypothetical protein
VSGTKNARRMVPARRKPRFLPPLVFFDTFPQVSRYWFLTRRGEPPCVRNRNGKIIWAVRNRDGKSETAACYRHQEKTTFERTPTGKWGPSR